MCRDSQGLRPLRQPGQCPGHTACTVDTHRDAHGAEFLVAFPAAAGGGGWWVMVAVVVQEVSSQILVQASIFWFLYDSWRCFFFAWCSRRRDRPAISRRLVCHRTCGGTVNPSLHAMVTWFLHVADFIIKQPFYLFCLHCAIPCIL